MNDGRARYEADDQQTRRQIRERLKDNLFVEAGAGTGKTSSLVERIVALVLDGTEIERIVAITFTEKAAAELRDRVRQALEDVPTVDPAEQALAAAALDALDRSQVSTIHAFCQSLIRSYAPECGVDPGFEVQDEVLAERRFEDQWRAYLEDLGEDPNAVRAVDRALDLGLLTSDIRSLAHELWLRPEVAVLLEEHPLTAPPTVWPDLEALSAHLREACPPRVPDDDPLRARIRHVEDVLQSLRERPDEREMLLAAHSGDFDRSFNIGQAPNWGGAAGKAAAVAAANGVCDELRNLLADLRSEVLQGILRLALRFALEDAAARAREGKLLFADLILRARELLHDPSVRDELRARYATLLIDEFQDTDPLQIEIARAFATDPATGRLDPGRLFLVGDPKQSIYRFRHADMASYSRVRGVVGADDGLLLSLALSRRSAPAVVDFVNATFGRLIGPGGDPRVQPAYVDIHAHRDDRPAGLAVGWFGEHLDEPARHIREEEARLLAVHCRAVVDHRWQVSERDGAHRLASFRDIAVLMPTRAALPALERSFSEAGIPYRVESGSLVLATQEIRDLLNCLTAIDDPADEVAVVGALRSPAFACSDVEIARFRRDGGSFSYLSPAVERQEGRVADALRALRRFHDERHAASLASLVERFVAERGLFEVGLLDTGSRDGFRRARYVIEQARAFEAGGPSSLRSLIAWLERRASSAVLEREGAGLDDDEDAVRVMTVHAAKGLEFPVVFVVGLGVQPANQKPVLTVDWMTDRVAIRLGAKSRGVFSLGPVADLDQLQTAYESAERDRVLYVAATRARDHLVLSLFHKNDSHAKRLVDVAGVKDLSPPLPPALIAPPPGTNPFADLQIDDLDTTPELFAGQRAAVVAGARVVRYTSATALAHARDAEASDPEDTEPWSRGRAGTHLGRAVHATIQSVGLDADASTIEAFARAQAVAEAVPDSWEEVARLVTVALRSEAASRARAARRALREVPFAFGEGESVVEGFIDLVIETDEGLEVVDWKTDHVEGSAIGRRLSEYETQAGLYVLGLERATGRRVQRITYAFVSAGEERSPGDPASLAAKALERLRTP